jgi:hypothetical protein
MEKRSGVGPGDEEGRLFPLHQDESQDGVSDSRDTSYMLPSVST